MIDWAYRCYVTSLVIPHADYQRFLRNSDSDVLEGPCPSAYFHALYGEHEAKIDIRTLEVIEGWLPNRAVALVLEWASMHRIELMEDWELCETMQPPKKIRSLE